MNLGTLKKTPTLSDQAYTTIKAAVMSNQLKPGEVLTTEALAAQLGISRTPITIALNRLAQEKIVVPQENKTMVVSTITQKDIDDVTAVRRILEPEAVRMLKGRLNAENIGELRAIQQNRRIYMEQGDIRSFIEADHIYHMKLVSFTGNDYLYATLEQLDEVTNRFLILSGTVRKHMHVAYEEHEEIIRYLEQGDFDGAANALLKHIDNVDVRMLA